MNDPCGSDKPASRRSPGDDDDPEIAPMPNGVRAFGFSREPEASDDGASKDAGSVASEGAGDIRLADKMRRRSEGVAPERKPVDVGQRSTRKAADVVFTSPPTSPAVRAPGGGSSPVVKGLAGAPAIDLLFMSIALVLFLVAVTAPWLSSESEETRLADGTVQPWGSPFDPDEWRTDALSSSTKGETDRTLVLAAAAPRFSPELQKPLLDVDTPKIWGSPLDPDATLAGGFSARGTDDRIEERLAVVDRDHSIGKVERTAAEFGIEAEPSTSKPPVGSTWTNRGEGGQSIAGYQLEPSIADGASLTTTRPMPALKPLALAAKQSTPAPVVVGTVVIPALKPRDFGVAGLEAAVSGSSAAEGFWQRFVQGVTSAFANRDTSYAGVLSAHASDRGDDGGRTDGDSGSDDVGGNSNAGGNGGSGRGGNGRGGDGGGDRDDDDDDDDD